MSGQPFRLAGGGLIDRSRTLRFTFDGKAYEGHPGDSLASALLANGVRLVGRSFKHKFDRCRERQPSLAFHFSFELAGRPAGITGEHFYLFHL